MSRPIILCALAVLALAACNREPDAPQSAATAPVVADAEVDAAPAPATAEFPSLKIETVDGSSFDVSAHRGKWLVVNFWATWCAPCIREMPELSALDERRKDLEVVGLAYEEIEVQAMRDFLKNRPVVYPIAILDVYNPPSDFATPRGLPMTYLLAPDGSVAKQFLGPVTAKEIEAAIVAGQPPKA